MSIKAFLNSLEEEKIKYSADEAMGKHTTFKTGGCADAFVEVSDIKELQCVTALAARHKVPFFVIGKGSNLLVSDDGIRGAVISLSGINFIRCEGEKIICGAGASLSAVCIAAKQASLTGSEFAYGIPGTVGGALFMNAGAYGGEMSQIVESAEVMDENGNIFTVSADDMQFGYRTSVFKNKGYIVISAVLKLKKGNPKEIAENMEELLYKRKSKQPLSYPSAGSTFKRPEGNFAGALIEKNNLKGYTLGGAQVSELHAGFIINRNNASAEDILKLMRYVQKTVYLSDGILLEPEILIKGESDFMPYKSIEDID